MYSDTGMWKMWRDILQGLHATEGVRTVCWCIVLWLLGKLRQLQSNGAAVKMWWLFKGNTIVSMWKQFLQEVKLCNMCSLWQCSCLRWLWNKTLCRLSSSEIPCCSWWGWAILLWMHSYCCCRTLERKWADVIMFWVVYMTRSQKHTETRLCSIIPRHIFFFYN